MDITFPPFTTNKDFNLRKQSLVFQLIVQDTLDNIVVPSLDCTWLERVHHIDLLHRAREKGCDGFGGLDYRKVLHAEYSCASMTASVNAVFKNKKDGKPTCVFAPVSGFHHAHYNRSGGFCTFNGLMAAAVCALEDHSARKILILDGDAHWGDGTQDIINQLQLHRSVDHISISSMDDWRNQSASPGGLDFSEYSLILYQAGADAHIEDPCGQGTFDTGSFITRDRRIFISAQASGVPIIVNLAGGYNGAKTLDLHTSTFQTLVETYYPEQDRPIIARGSTVDLDGLLTQFGEKSE